MARFWAREEGMLVDDGFGNSVTACGSEPAQLFGQTVAAFLGFRRDTGDRLRQVLAADPGFALAHCLRGYFMMLFGQRAMVPRAERALATARDAARAAGTTPRERAHLAALAAWVAGDFADATARWDAVAAAHPHDVLALRLAQYGYFYAGDSSAMHTVLARALPAWNASVPGYGFILGCHAFGLEQVGDCLAAERAARHAIDHNAADIWAAHALIHVFEMTDRPREGIGWIDRLEANWSACNNFAGHLFWHRCLFWLELDESDRVLDLYDREVRPEPTDDLLDISNAASLLWRLEQEGVDVGSRWHELAACAELHLDDHALIFGDIHYLTALAAAGHADAARMVESLSRYASESGESQAAIAGEPGLALARALLAHRRRDHKRVLDELLPVRHAIRRIGGSHAQRDLFDQMLIDSALSAGRLDLTQTLLMQRLERRPGNAWARRRARIHGWRDESDAGAARLLAEA